MVILTSFIFVKFSFYVRFILRSSEGMFVQDLNQKFWNKEKERTYIVMQKKKKKNSSVIFYHVER
jgi:hypothetical protein